MHHKAMKIEPFTVQSNTISTVLFFVQTMSLLSTERFTSGLYGWMAQASTLIRAIGEVVSLRAAAGDSCPAVFLSAFVNEWYWVTLAPTAAMCVARNGRTNFKL